tara:strand:+ start:60 stop:251 length:192 start_codon:yes stop_codon:yes gene_type:complete
MKIVRRNIIKDITAEQILIDCVFSLGKNIRINPQAKGINIKAAGTLALTVDIISNLLCHRLNI